MSKGKTWFSMVQEVWTMGRPWFLLSLILSQVEIQCVESSARPRMGTRAASSDCRTDPAVVPLTPPPFLQTQRPTEQAFTPRYAA